ncbi:MAG: sterol desaturase family protein [bacterium]|nr:sterol desaturase family protein [Candidatus Kapabacteria bacterium]
MARRYVSNKNESVRMFKNDFLEACSHIHPLTIPSVWVPVTIGLMYLSVYVRDLNTLPYVGLFFLGMFLWTFAEYTMHRYIFHYEPKTALGKRIHFLMHGVHHDYPNDATRLVMPLGFSVPLAVGFYFLFCAIFGDQHGPAVLSGFIIGYVCYDMVHYATHHLQMRGPLGAWLKKHHLKHHYMDDGYGYGVSTPMWDVVFGTMRLQGTSEERHQIGEDVEIQKVQGN